MLRIPRSLAPPSLTLVVLITLVGPLLATTLVPPGTAIGAAEAATTAGRATSLERPGDRKVVSREVSFRVRNINRTTVPCAGDGRTHVLRGRLIGPRVELRRPELRRALVHVHDISTGGWFWNLRSRPAHDHVRRLARAGLVSVVLDRLGYDASPLADGNRTCFGAQADMLHQVIQQLRDGSYRSSGPVRSVGHVVSVGHSVGAAIAQLEAARWGDVGGLVQMSWSDAGASPRAITEAARQHAACVAGPSPLPGYAYFGQSAASWRSLMFHSAPTAVRRAAVERRNPDPCGDVLGLSALLAENAALAQLVIAPVLLLYGERDVLNRPDARETQRAALRNAESVTERVLPDTGGALPLEASAPQTRRIIVRWVCARLACDPRWIG